MGLTATALALAALPAGAESLSSPGIARFQEPSTAAWGLWSRGSVGTLHAGWDVIGERSGIRFSSDSTPDLGSFNTSRAVLLAYNPSAFVTGSRNVYSFADINDFEIIITADRLDPGQYTAALQMAVVGRDIDHSSVLLNGEPWTRYELLGTGEADLPPGHPPIDGGAGLSAQHLFLWEALDRVSARDPFNLTWRAAGTSNSLVAVQFDVGTPIPLPAGVLPFTVALGWLLRRRQSPRRQA